MTLCKLFKQEKFVITSEVGPPKGTDVTKLLEEAEEIKDKVDGINVTDLQSSVMLLGSMAVCALLKQKGIEPVYQLTCRDRNRLALQSDLLSAYALGIRNTLLLTGDHPACPIGDHPQAKPVFDLDSVQLIQTAVKLKGGHDLSGNELKGTPSDFCLGAVVSPCSDALDLQIMKMEKKIKAGAQFFQTQGVYDAKQFEQFMKKVEQFKVPVMAGIIFLKSAGMAKFMNNNVAGVTVPQPLIDEMASVEKEKRKDKCVEIMSRLIKKMKGMCQGVHLMPQGWGSLVPRVIEEAEL
jgi:5,10-methylenetetrahydrofolate reductase